MTELAEFWNNVHRGHRHIVDSMDKEKIIYTIKRFETMFLPYLDKQEINTSLDWGCGGGLLAKELTKFSDVYVLDISKKSLSSCLEYVGKDSIKDAYLVEDVDAWQLPSFKFDLLHCEAVIHHFPSLAYWKKVAAIWNKLNPKYIAIQTKWATESVEKEDYYSDNNYVTGLKLSTKDVLESFPDYNVLSSKMEKVNSGADCAFYVFRRKGV